MFAADVHTERNRGQYGLEADLRCDLHEGPHRANGLRPSTRSGNLLESSPFSPISIGDSTSGVWTGMTLKSEYLVFIDFEASGLGPGTWPIEVGLAWIENGGVRTWSSLIRPEADWDPDA